MELIKRRITNLGCSETGQFQVDCETYHSSPNLVVPGQGSGQVQKILHVLHNSEYPATVFSVLEPQPGVKTQPTQLQSPANRITFTTDYLFDLLLLKLSSVYEKNKQNQKIVSKGNRYEIGDFVVKVSPNKFRFILLTQNVTTLFLFSSKSTLYFYYILKF